MKGLLALLAAVAAAFATGLLLLHFGMLAFVQAGAQVIVPDLVGLDLAEARAELDRVGFAAVVDREENSTEFERGRILQQRPRPGDVQRKGRKVWLTVSLGVREARVPNLVGMSYRQADIVLGQESFTKGTTTRVHHPDVSRGAVIAQDPPAGAPGAEGGSVDLLVSLGPAAESFVLPALAGRTQRDAEDLLESHGLTVGARTVMIDPSVLPATVLEQDPPAGSRVERGDEVDLVVSSRR